MTKKDCKSPCACDACIVAHDKALRQQRKEILKEVIESMPKEREFVITKLTLKEPEGYWDAGFNQALKEVISILKKTLE